MFAERLSVSPHRISSDTRVSENAGVFSAKLAENLCYIKAMMKDKFMFLAERFLNN